MRKKVNFIIRPGVNGPDEGTTIFIDMRKNKKKSVKVDMKIQDPRFRFSESAEDIKCEFEMAEDNADQFIDFMHQVCIMQNTNDLIGFLNTHDHVKMGMDMTLYNSDYINTDWIKLNYKQYCNGFSRSSNNSHIDIEYTVWKDFTNLDDKKKGIVTLQNPIVFIAWEDR